MKKGIHPKYERVVFKCAGSGQNIVTRSTKLDGPVADIDGEKMPSVLIEVSAYCHPFYTGKQQFIDTEGRVEKFNTRFKRAVKK